MTEITSSAAMRAPPFPPDTKAKGWRFELDMERVAQSDTWALAPAEMRPWLLMLWTVAWQQVPCGSMPMEDGLIAARLGMSLKAFIKAKPVLMRGWWPADDGRLYQDTIAERVLEMLECRRKNAKRVADHKAAKRAQRVGTAEASGEQHGGNALPTREQPTSNDTRTRTGTSTSSAPDGAGGLAPPPDPAEVIFALGVPLLTASGAVSERNARSMLGLQRKKHGDLAVASAIARCAEERPSEPVAWMQKALQMAAPKKSNHAGFNGRNYREGVTEDGSIT